ncbi:unnamed protein product [Arctogadus glacialis]
MPSKSDAKHIDQHWSQAIADPALDSWILIWRRGGEGTELERGALAALMEFYTVERDSTVCPSPDRRHLKQQCSSSETVTAVSSQRSGLHRAVLETRLVKEAEPLLFQRQFSVTERPPKGIVSQGLPLSPSLGPVSWP